MRLPKGASVFWRPSKKRWVLSYADPALGRPQKILPETVTSETAANRWALEYLAEKGLNPSDVLQRRKSTGPTVADCAARWLKLREADERVAPATLKANKGHLNGYILPAFGGVPIAALEVRALRAWLRELRGKMSASTCRNIRATFSVLYADAMAEEWIKRDANLLDHPGVKAELPELESGEPMVLPVAWVQQLISDSTIHVERRARYALAFTTGMRDGEVSGVRIKDLDLASPIPSLRIEQAVAIVGEKGPKGFAKAKGPKTKKSRRTLPLHDAARAALQEWIEGDREALLGGASSEFLFPRPDGRGARPRSAERLRVDLGAIGLPTEIREEPVEFKATRSSFATWLEDAGVSEAIRKRLMGHAARDVTERHYTARELAPLAAAVATIQLVWHPSGTRPNLVTSGTRNDEMLNDFMAPPAGIEPATNGLGILRTKSTACDRRADEAHSSALKSTRRKDLRSLKGLRKRGRRGAELVTEDLDLVRRGLEVLVSVDTELERWILEGKK